MKNSKAVIIKTLSSPIKEEGLHFRLTCLTGKNKGQCYYLTGKRVIMGRGDQCDIPIHDAKASREHIEIVLVDNDYILTDLKSQNGTYVNDNKIQRHTLVENDKIIVGQTVFKFNKINIAKSHLEIVQDADEVEKASSLPPASSTAKPTSFIIILALLGIVAFFFLSDDESTDKKVISKESSKRVQDVSDSFAMLAKKKIVEDKDIKEKVAAAIHRGLREYREKNYFRAINEFSFALVLSPSNSKANFYLSKTKQSLDDDIAQNFLKARRDVEALKYSAAVTSYCAIVRLLLSYPEDARYKDALENIKSIEKKMGMSEGEIKCL